MRYIRLLILFLLLSIPSYSQTTFTKRWIVIIPAAIRDNVNTRIAGQGSFGNNTFSIPIVAIADPNTILYYATNWQMTPAQRTAIENYCRNNSISGQTIWSRIVASVDVSNYDSLTGTPNFASALASRGLMVKPSTQANP